MRKRLAFGLGCLFLAGTAPVEAEPVSLDDQQLDRIAAGGLSMFIKGEGSSFGQFASVRGRAGISAATTANSTLGLGGISIEALADPADGGSASAVADSSAVVRGADQFSITTINATDPTTPLSLSATWVRAISGSP